MTLKKRYFFFRLFAIVCALIFLSFPAAVAQWQTAPTEANLGEPVSYSYGLGLEYQGKTATWQPGSVSTTVGGTGLHATVTFTTVGPNFVSWVIVGGPSAQLSVNVYPAKPKVQSISPAVVCGTGQVTVTVSHPATPGSINAFLWYTTDSGGSPFANSLTTMTQTVSASTTWWVSTYNSFAGESRDRTRVDIIVNNNVVNAPTLTTPAYGIAGEQVRLQVNYAGANISYKWQEGSSTTVTSENFITKTVPNTSTLNFVSVRLANGSCESPSTPISITVYPKPVITGTGMALGEPATLTCTPTYDSYTWYLNGNQVYSSSISSNNTCPATTPGIYTVAVTKNGASSSSDGFTLTAGGQFSGQNENYVVTNTIQVKDVTTTGQVDVLTKTGNAQSLQYFDGLGRPMQAVSTQGSPSGNDIVQPIVYDAYGREPKKHLPVAPVTHDGWYKRDLIDNAGNYAGVAAANVYNNGTGDKIDDSSQPYSETVFEASPLNRILKQGAPGTAWQPLGGTYAEPSPNDHSIKKAYVYNGPNEVILLDYNETTKRIGLDDTNYYVANRLYVNKTKDEHNKEVIEYVDKDGRTILKKVQTLDGSQTVYAETYYIYDDFGNLMVVLPPEAMKRVRTIFNIQP